MVLINKDVSEVTGDLSSFGVLPTGQYLAQISKGEAQTSKAGNQMVVLDWTVLEDYVFEGKYVGQVVKDYLMLDGRGQRAGDIKLRDILKAVRTENTGYIEDTDEILGLSCLLDIQLREDSYTNPETGAEGIRQQNRIIKYSPVSETEEAAPVQQVQQAQAQAARTKQGKPFNGGDAQPAGKTGVRTTAPPLKQTAESYPNF